MVPGIDENDAGLLEETGTIGRRELVSQDPVAQQDDRRSRQSQRSGETL